eukprot:1159690-Pelagomonas_calceolata.AAC.3
MSVQDYANLFRQQIVHAPEMHENDRWFHAGLPPQLKPQRGATLSFSKTRLALSLVSLLLRAWLWRISPQQKSRKEATQINQASTLPVAGAAPSVGVPLAAAGEAAASHPLPLLLAKEGVRVVVAEQVGVAQVAQAQTARPHGPRTTAQDALIPTRFKDLSSRNLSQAELHILKAEGICFNCFQSGHHIAHCPGPAKPLPDDPPAPK